MVHVKIIKIYKRGKHLQNFRIITNENQFQEIKSQWCELYEKLDNVTVFQSYEWNYQFWKNIHQEDKLFIVVFFGKNINSLSAIFPLIVDKKRRLRFIGDIHSDYSDFLITNMEIIDQYDLFKTFQKIIHNENMIKSIELKNINFDNIYLGFMGFQFDYKQIVYQSNAYSYTTLKGDEEFFKSFSHFKSRQRSELKRIYKKNEKFTSHIYDNFKTPIPIEKIKKLMLCMVDNSSRGEGFLDEKLLSTIETLYIKGYLLINEVNKNDNSIAMNFILYNRNKYIFWIDLYDDIKFINIYSYLKFMEHVCMDNKENENIFDFGRGLYNYKIKNFYPLIKPQVTFFYSKKNSIYIMYIMKLFLKLIVKNFYKNNKLMIDKILGRS